MQAVMELLEVPERDRPPECAVNNIDPQTGRLLKDPWSSLCYRRHVYTTGKEP